MDALPTMISIMNRQLVQLTGDVVCGAGVHVPVGVYSISRCSSGGRLLWRTREGLIKPLEAIESRMALVAADLSDDSGLERDALDTVASTCVASIVAASSAEATTTPVGVVAAAASYARLAEELIPPLRNSWRCSWATNWV